MRLVRKPKRGSKRSKKCQQLIYLLETLLFVNTFGHKNQCGKKWKFQNTKQHESGLISEIYSRC